MGLRFLVNGFCLGFGLRVDGFGYWAEGLDLGWVWSVLEGFRVSWVYRIIWVRQFREMG